MKNLISIIILIITNVLILLYYSSKAKNDIFFAFVTFITPFLSLLLFLWFTKKNIKIYSKEFIYLILSFFCAYFVLILLIEVFHIGKFYYEKQTVFFISLFLMIISIFLYFKNLVK